jgi:Fe-S cluster biogenesis protein NfuA
MNEEMTEEEKQAAYAAEEKAAEEGEAPKLSPEEQAVKDDIMNRIQHTLNKIRPYLQAEGGDVVLVDYANGTAAVAMYGACAGCIMASADVSQGVQALVVDEVPEVNKVVLVSPNFHY